MKRQIVYNVLSEPGEDPPKQSWIFVIVNEPREISIIEQKIKEHLAPTEGYTVIAESHLGDGIHVKTIYVDSYRRMTPRDFDPSKIYKGREKGSFRRDEKLGHHRKSGSLEAYIERLARAS